MDVEQTDLSIGELLIKGSAQYGIELQLEQVKDFIEYSVLLKEWNEKINLTAIVEDKEIAIKHFIDSFSIMPFISKEINRIKNGSIVDVGTGAGFPGLPLKIANISAEVTLIDSLDKRVKFLNLVIDQLKLQNIKAVHGRAEDLGINAAHREKYDIATARAVANLPILLEYCLPFVKVGGVFIAMKGSNTEELDNSKKALDVLGGKIEIVKELTLPFSDNKRNIIVVRKYRHTPTKYPRKAGKPSKEPLI